MLFPDLFHITYIRLLVFIVYYVFFSYVYYFLIIIIFASKLEIRVCIHFKVFNMSGRCWEAQIFHCFCFGVITLVEFVPIRQRFGQRQRTESLRKLQQVHNFNSSKNFSVSLNKFITSISSLNQWRLVEICPMSLPPTVQWQVIAGTVQQQAI